MNSTDTQEHITHIHTQTSLVYEHLISHDHTGLLISLVWIEWSPFRGNLERMMFKIAQGIWIYIHFGVLVHLKYPCLMAQYFLAM